MSTVNDKKTAYDNVILVSNLAKQNEMSELIKNIKESKRQIDVILKQLKEKEKDFVAESVAPPQESASLSADAAAEKEIKAEAFAINLNSNKPQDDGALAESAAQPASKTPEPEPAPAVKPAPEPSAAAQPTVETENVTAQAVGVIAEKGIADDIVAEKNKTEIAAADTSVVKVVKQPDTKEKSQPETTTKAPKAETDMETLTKAAPARKSETTRQTDIKAEKQQTHIARDVKKEPENLSAPVQADKSESVIPTKLDEKIFQKSKKAKTAEDRFKESLPKPINTENRRFINLTPERPKPVERYQAPRTEGRPPYNNYGNAGASGGAGGGYNRPRPAGTAGPGAQQGFKKDFADNSRGGPIKRPQSRAGGQTAPSMEVHKDTKQFSPVKKKAPDKNYDNDKKVMNKRTLIRRGFETDITLTGDDNIKVPHKLRSKKKDEREMRPQPVVIEKATVNMDIIPIKVLSDKLGITAAEITKKLFKDGIIKTINESLDYETAALLAVDLGIELELKFDKTAEDTLTEFHEMESQDDSNMVKRPPVVTVMGHVDHGKTSLLDAIKSTHVADGEAGGITQHIGAYTIKVKDEKITFIDTPGHEAFTAMRARGASVTDIAVLVVAADDGIMPQTVEAINHAKAANVPIVIAINKMDKPTADPERIKQQLTEHGIVPEEWGGDAIICPVSAKSRQGIDQLLEMLLLVADVKELKANPNRKAKGTIIEAKLDKGKGPVASVLVQNGTLRVGDTVVAGITSGRIRAMLDEKGRNIKEAGPSIAVSVLGFSEVPNAGDNMFVMEDEKQSRQVAEERLNKLKSDMVKTSAKVTLDDVFGKIAEGQVKGLNVIIKADVQGSVEAVRQALEKLTNEEVKVNVIHGGVGAVSETDVMLAQTAAAIVIAFNVKPDNNAKQLSEKNNVDVRLYKIIYEVTDDIQKSLKGMVEPKYKEVVLGQAEVRNVFKITGAGIVAGSYVTSGKLLRNSKVRLLRGTELITESSISSLKRFKDDVKEVASGYECGISLDGFVDVKEGDIIECFQMEEIVA